MPRALAIGVLFDKGSKEIPDCACHLTKDLKRFHTAHAVKQKIKRNLSCPCCSIKALKKSTPCMFAALPCQMDLFEPLRVFDVVFLSLLPFAAPV